MTNFKSLFRFFSVLTYLQSEICFFQRVIYPKEIGEKKIEDTLLFSYNSIDCFSFT